ncbi:MAG: hypothetical protein HWE30_09550 [Methylocystaceae bacterium]|nr:hypothetical protein [Methylocystaceae bacterium]
MNSPQVLSLIFPVLALMVTIALLRWAVSGEKTDKIASLSIGLACLIAALIAFGRPTDPFQFGTGALSYTIGAASILTLICVSLSDNPIIRFITALGVVLLWEWSLLGMPYDLGMMVKASYAGTILMTVSTLFVFRSRWEVNTDGSFAGNLISLSVISGSAWLVALLAQDTHIQPFALGLTGISLSALFWTIKKITFTFHENAVVVLNLCVSAVVWDLWLNGHLPIISLICLILVLFTRSACVHVLGNAPRYLQKAYYGVLFLMGLLPAGLSLLFFDILRNL